MRKLFMTLCMAGAMAALTSCKTSQNTASTAKSLDGEWSITEVEGYKVTNTEPGREAFIGFKTGDKQMYGCAGCNRIFGGLDTEGGKGKLSFGNVGSTRMMCADMTTEDKVLQAVNRVAAFEVQKDGSLILKAADGKELMKLVKK